MTTREFVRLLAADGATTRAVMSEQLTTTLVVAAVIVVVAVPFLFTSGLATAVLVVVALGVVAALVTVPMRVRAFKRGKLPPPGLYRVGFGPKRRFDGHHWQGDA
jgi:hypothetical protein